VATVGLTLQTMLGGRQVTRFKKDGEQYDVIVQVRARSHAPERHQRHLRARARRQHGAARQRGGRAGRRVAAIVESLPAPARGDDHRIARTGLHTRRSACGAGRNRKAGAAADALTDLNGQSREFRDARGGFYLTLVLALVFIYLVLSAQFESFADPFVIMLSVPLSMTGALLALYFTGGTWNIYSQIGVVTLWA